MSVFSAIETKTEPLNLSRQDVVFLLTNPLDKRIMHLSDPNHTAQQMSARVHLVQLYAPYIGRTCLHPITASVPASENRPVVYTNGDLAYPVPDFISKALLDFWKQSIDFQANQSWCKTFVKCATRGHPSKRVFEYKTLIRYKDMTKTQEGIFTRTKAAPGMREGAIAWAPMIVRDALGAILHTGIILPDGKVLQKVGAHPQYAIFSMDGTAMASGHMCPVTCWSGTPKETCDACGSKTETRRCVRCFEVQYCSRDCQKAHWKQHKPECKTDEELASQVGQVKEALTTLAETVGKEAAELRQSHPQGAAIEEFISKLQETTDLD